jgi:hypothetical protein
MIKHVRDRVDEGKNNKGWLIEAAKMHMSSLIGGGFGGDGCLGGGGVGGGEIEAGGGESGGEIE